MIREVLHVEEVISVPGEDNNIIDVDSKRFDGISFTAALMKPDSKVYVIAQVKNLKQPTVCKLNPRLDKLRFIRVSSTLRFILCVGVDSKFEIVDVSQFLNRVKPGSAGFSNQNDEFSLQSLKIQQLGEKGPPVNVRYSPSSRIIDAFWRESHLIMVESNGIHVIDVTNPDAQVKSLAISDITSAYFSLRDNGVAVAAFSNSKLKFVRINFGRDVVISSQTEKEFPGELAHAQCGLNTEWLLSVLVKGKAVIELEKDLSIETKNIGFDVKGVRQLLRTSSFLWVVTSDGSLKVSFVSSANKQEVILRNVVGIELVNDTEIMVRMKNSVALVYVKENCERIFTSLIFEKKFDEAVNIGEGLGMNIPFLFQYVINRYVKDHNLKGILQIFEHPKCDRRDSLSRILQEGNDRLAWYLILRYPQFQRFSQFVESRVTRKYSIFRGFMFEYTKIFERKRLLALPERPPLALRFRMQMESEKEETDVKVLQAASHLDFPKRVVFSFSQAYLSLLRQLSAMKDVVEEEMELPPCVALQKYGDSWVYMNHAGKLSMQTENLTVASFCLRGNTLFIITNRLEVFKTELPRVDMIELDMNRALKMVTNGKGIAFLSVSGPIWYEDGEEVVGSFVDVAMGTNVVFGLSDDGVIFRIVHNTTEKIRTKEFIQAITAAGDCVVGLSSKGKVIIIPPNTTPISVDIDFPCEVIKNVNDKAVIAGAGHLLVISENGEHTTELYSDRIGRVLDVAIDSDSCYVLCGSVGAPMKVFNEPHVSNSEPSLPEMKMLVAEYPKDFLVSIFHKRLYKTFVYVLAKDFGSLTDTSALVTLVPYLNDIDPASAAEVMHAFIALGRFNELPENVLKADYARECFMRHKEDLKCLNKGQLFSLLPKIESPEQNSVDALSTRLVQKSNQSTVVPSLRFKEGRLFVFSCGHILNKNEMLASVNDVKKLCASHRLASTGQVIFDTYLMPAIPAQCPRCLYQRLQVKLRNK